MNISSFKDIDKIISQKYPNRKIYIISDHHFNHSNIIKYTNRLFNDVKEMNNHIIKTHNQVVNHNDIVIFLGDFNFKPDTTKEILNNLNGIKYLVLGNHDSKCLLTKHKQMGFEEVFLYPVLFKNSVLSHYPLDKELPDEIIYNILRKEYLKNNYFNYYGHIHEKQEPNNSNCNVTCDNLEYKPLFIGYSSQNSNNNPFFIDNKEFNYFLNYFINNKNINKDLLISDYIYSTILSYLSNNNNIFFSGSFILYKKHNFYSRFSDLDATILPKVDSKNQAIKEFKKVTQEVFSYLNQCNHLQLDYYKKTEIINIIRLLYLDGHGYYLNNFFDFNLFYENIYQDNDFEYQQGKMLIDHLIIKYFKKDYQLPTFNCQVLKDVCLLSNCLLQYFYEIDHPEKKKLILKKINFILKNINKEDFTNNFENTITRFLLRNLLFFSNTNRNREIDYIFNFSLNNFLSNLPKTDLTEEIRKVFADKSSDYNHVLDTIKTSSKKDLTNNIKTLTRSFSK